MATFVLVHGGGHGGWCYQRVARRLRDQGHDVYTPTLTGLGERSHLATPTTDLDTHVTDVAAVLHYEDLTDVVLVGHSYGGMVITGAADRAAERIGRLVYLDADVPRDGESEFDLMPADECAGYEESARARGNGWLVPPPFPDPLPPGLPPVVVWGVGRMAPHPLATMTQPLRLSDPPPDLPRIYVYCSEGKDGEPEPPYLSRVRSDPDWQWVELAAPHTAHVMAPEKLTATLLDLVDA